ncbi:MAG TPA: transporter substrate-binding domain-containing protein [Azospirillaceae bacterium]|nr:transporter substrate-binding domain-containing protein [Azospirillaceae bacterium]
MSNSVAQACCRLLAGLFLLAAPTAGAQTGAAAGPVRFCYSDWVPYVTGADGPEGISVDVLTEAARRIGREATFTGLPWARCLAETSRGGFDAAMDAVPRAGYVSGRHSYIFSYEGFWVRADDPLERFTDIAEFSGRTVNLIQGWWYVDEVLRDDRLVLVRLPSEQSQLLSLQSRRQDLAFGDLVTLAKTAQALKARVRPLLPPVAEVKVYPLFNPAAAETAGRMDEAIGAMLADGAVDDIYRRHTGVSLSDLRRMVLDPAASPALQSLLGF